MDEMTKMEPPRLVFDIHKQLGLTTLIITHSIEEALTLATVLSYILKIALGRLLLKLTRLSEDEDKGKSKDCLQTSNLGRIRLR